MKLWRQRWPVTKALGAGAVIAAIMAVAAWRVWSTPFGLKITLTSTNTVALSITNAATNGIYEIWWTEFLDPNSTFTNCDWWLVQVGSAGQTNFGPYYVSETYTGFFLGLGTDDFDGDGVPDYQDARPFDPSVGTLTVTIESPANGALVY